jgi:hypothetical protein
MNDLITIVSGLPRSGTSLMMRMLEAGGMDVVVDHIRQADEDNPLGYYEFEKVKKIREDASWLDDARGKVFKMVSMLLYDLPQDRRYRIIFMKRKMAEMLASQRKMLDRKGSKGAAGDEEMGRLYGKHLAEIEQWFGEQKSMEVLFVSYNDLIEHPVEHLRRVNRFLGDGLDIGKMQGVIDKSLYRQRS